MFLSDSADMCYTHLSGVFRRLNMLPVSHFQTFLCPGSDDSSNKSSQKGGVINKDESTEVETQFIYKILKEELQMDTEA